MDKQEEILERCLSARERSLQEKIVRLENQLQGYKSQIDILENQRQKLEEESVNMESALTKTKTELLEARKEVLDKEIAEIHLSEKLKSMTSQADEYKRLFMTESSKNSCGIERLETLISKTKARTAHEKTKDQFEGFKDILNAVQEGFTAQLRAMLDKIIEAENKLCGSLQETRRSNSTDSAHGDDGKDALKDFYPDGPHVEPIIPLPEKIDVKTGEENEEVMFSHRAKLYRFVAEDKQWKERGVGDIKLLRNNLTGKMRVLMRREQVLKLCANHQITSDMKLQPNAGSDSSWVWSTPADFSEEECKPERLAVRFKHEEIAKQFKEKFERCQEILKEQASLKLPTQEETGQEGTVENDLLARFRAAEGSWECDTCMVRNDSGKVKCVACGTMKPGVEIPEGKKTDGKSLFGSGFPSSAGRGFPFGSGASFPGSGFSFGSGEPGFSFGSAGAGDGSRKLPFSFGSAVSFGAAQQGGNTLGQSDEQEKKGEETPGEEAGQRKSDHTRTSEEGDNAGGDPQDSNIEEASAKPVPGEDEERREEDAGRDLFEKWKPKEGSWECDTCLVRNDSDKVECAACGSPNPGADPVQVPARDGRSVFGSGASSFGAGFTFGSSAPSSSAGFTFGSSAPSSSAGFAFGSSAPSFGTGLLFGTSEPSSGSGFVFGSTGQSSGGESPFSVFGSQTQGTSSGPANLPFVSLAQTDNLSAAKTKGTEPSEVESVSVDQEEKPRTALQGGELGPQSAQDGACEDADAAATQGTEGSVLRPHESSDESHPEERVSLSSEKPVEDIPEEYETVQNESAIEEASQTSEPQGGVSGSSSDQPKEEV